MPPLLLAHARSVLLEWLQDNSETVDIRLIYLIARSDKSRAT